MLPELATLIINQIPDIEATVKESTDTLSTEITNLRELEDFPQCALDKGRTEEFIVCSGPHNHLIMTYL